MKLENSINSAERLPVNQTVNEDFADLIEQLKQKNQRTLLLIQGDREICLQQLPVDSLPGDPIILSNQSTPTGSIAFNKAENLLGNDTHYLVYDLHCGLNVDVFCIAAGLVKAPGLMVVIAPSSLDDFDDPYACWQGQSMLPSQFLLRLIKQIPFQFHIDQSSAMKGHLVKLEPSTAVELVEGKTVDQARLLKAMQQWWLDQSEKLFLLTADRGRGKSTALGLFAASLQHQLPIIVTSASRQQVNSLFRQLPESHQVKYVAPDELLRFGQPIPLLIVDEAAMLSLSLLLQLFRIAKRLVLCTTTGGYEGTGQGFLLKFIGRLPVDEFIHEQLFEPIRWGNRDQLEQWVNQQMMLSRQPLQDIVFDDSLQIAIMDKSRIVADRNLLQQIYTLLVAAHYRTRPSDLRQLVDDATSQIIIATTRSSVVGVLIINAEGGLDDELSEQVFLGRRRPQGHLLAQMMTAQAGIKHFSRHRGFRIQRIAVHQDCRRRGVGKQLIEHAQVMLRQQGLEYMGSCFALDYTMSPFWKKAGFELVHVAAGRGRATGRQTVAVLSSGNHQVKRWIEYQHKKLADDLPVMLLTWCKNLCWQDVKALIQLLSKQYAMDDVELQQVAAFATAHRGFELSQTSLQRWLINRISGSSEFNQLNEHEQAVLIETILMNRKPMPMMEGDPSQGRKQLIRQIKDSMTRIL